MNSTYLHRLTPAVQAFELDIERAAGIEIDVKIDVSRDGRGPDGAGIIACEIDERGATLLAPNEAYFPDGGVVHELLHMRRTLVERVPKLAANLGFAHWTPQLENGGETYVRNRYTTNFIQRKSCKNWKGNANLGFAF